MKSETSTSALPSETREEQIARMGEEVVRVDGKWGLKSGLEDGSVNTAESLARAVQEHAEGFERRFRAWLSDDDRRTYDAYTVRFDRLRASLTRAFVASEYGEMIVYANEVQSTMLGVLAERVVWQAMRLRFAERCDVPTTRIPLR